MYFIIKGRKNDTSIPRTIKSSLREINVPRIWDGDVSAMYSGAACIAWNISHDCFNTILLDLDIAIAREKHNIDKTKTSVSDFALRWTSKSAHMLHYFYKTNQGRMFFLFWHLSIKGMDNWDLGSVPNQAVRIISGLCRNMPNWRFESAHTGESQIDANYNLICTSLYVVSHISPFCIICVYKWIGLLFWIASISTSDKPIETVYTMLKVQNGEGRYMLPGSIC